MFEWAGRIASSLLGRLAYAVGEVSDYLNGLFEILLNVLSSFFVYLLGQAIEFFASCIDRLPSFPEYIRNSSSYLSQFIFFAYRLDSFFPVYELLVSLAFFFSFVSIFFVVKMVLKLIPTIG
jgi:hypothetical protein